MGRVRLQDLGLGVLKVFQAVWSSGCLSEDLEEYGLGFRGLGFKGV